METAIAIELTRLAVQLAVRLMVTAGMTEEQLDIMFQEERDKLLQRDPSKLPDV